MSSMTPSASSIKMRGGLEEVRRECEHEFHREEEPIDKFQEALRRWLDGMAQPPTIRKARTNTRSEIVAQSTCRQRLTIGYMLTA